MRGQPLGPFGDCPSLTRLTRTTNKVVTGHPLELARGGAMPNLLKAEPHGVREASRGRSAGGSLHKDVHQLANGPDGVDAALKEADLVGDAGAAEPGDTQAQLRDGREGDAGEEVAGAVHHHAVLGGRRGAEGAVLDEVGVDDRVIAGMTITASEGSVSLYRLPLGDLVGSRTYRKL